MEICTSQSKSFKHRIRRSVEKPSSLPLMIEEPLGWLLMKSLTREPGYDLFHELEVKQSIGERINLIWRQPVDALLDFDG